MMVKSLVFLCPWPDSISWHLPSDVVAHHLVQLDVEVRNLEVLCQQLGAYWWVHRGCHGGPKPMVFDSVEFGLIWVYLEFSGKHYIWIYTTMMKWVKTLQPLGFNTKIAGIYECIPRQYGRRGFNPFLYRYDMAWNCAWQVCKGSRTHHQAHTSVLCFQV